MQYEYGQHAKKAYEVGGGALDYALHTKATLSLMFQLRDTGRHGIEYPTEYIVPAAEDARLGTYAMCGELRRWSWI